MKSPLRILHLEDDANDASLVQAALEAAAIPNQTICVEGRHDFVSALERGGFDLVLSDYTLPTFDGLSAIAAVRAEGAGALVAWRSVSEFQNAGFNLYRRDLSAQQRIWTRVNAALCATAFYEGQVGDMASVVGPALMTH
jgi:CheY-like chemotaxis protein